MCTFSPRDITLAHQGIQQPGAGATFLMGSLTDLGDVLRREITNMNVLGFIVVAGALLLYVCLLGPVIVRAKRRGIALRGALIGFGTGVGLVVLVASVCFVALVWRVDVNDHVGRSIIAGIVIFVATLPALVLGLLGSLVGAWRGAAWRPPVEPELEGSWKAPDIADVQRVVAGEVVSPSSSSN
jgi:hypothetical protein